MTDYLGSIRQTFDEGATVVSAQDYYPYGEVLRSYVTGSNVNDKYKFTEKERDVETNYDYFGVRYYDSELTRWLQVDPLADKYPGCSPYNYALNNPLRFIDPNGMYVGDYYDESGNYIGTDGRNDNKNYVVPNNNIGIVQEALNSSTIIGSENMAYFIASSNSILLPSTAAISEMKSNLSGNPDTANLEAAGTIFLGKNGQDVELTANYGQLANNGQTSQSAPIDIKSTEMKQMPLTTGTVNYYYHSHPNGNWKQPPSSVDLLGSRSYYVPKISNMVLGTGNNTIYFFYDGKVQATMPLNKFFNLK